MAYEDDWVLGDLVAPERYGPTPEQLLAAYRATPATSATPKTLPGSFAPGSVAAVPPPHQAIAPEFRPVPRELPPEFKGPQARSDIVEETLPKAHALDPVYGQQRAAAKEVTDLLPIGSVADLYNSYQNADPIAGGVAAAGLLPIPGAKQGARIAKAGLKVAEEVAEPALKKGAKEAVTAPAILKADLGYGPQLPNPTPELVRPSIAEKYLEAPLREANPGVYKRPDVIAREANELVQPEHPALKQLFGVTRDDLYEISKQGTRQGNLEPKLWTPGKPTEPNAASMAVMTPENTQRLVDTLTEAKKHPELTKGMVPWYVMDPMYQRMVQLVGPEEAKLAYNRFNHVVSPFSAGSDVLTEINRGTTAHMYGQRGDLLTFQKYGNVAEKNRGPDFPADMRDVKGHMMHGNQVLPAGRFLMTGEHGYGNDTVKIPLYTMASGVPQTGFQTRWAVPDTHFASAIGMPEVRTMKDFRTFMGGTEYRPIAPWFRDKVAGQVGLEAVPGQALTWGTFAPQTGVRTGIGAGKLELLSQQIWERAARLGIDPMKLRDDVLMGKEHALLALGIGVPATAAAASQMGGVANPGSYQLSQ